MDQPIFLVSPSPNNEVPETVRNRTGQERRFLPDGTEVTGTPLHAEGAPIHRDPYHLARKR